MSDKKVYELSPTTQNLNQDEDLKDIDIDKDTDELIGRKIDVRINESKDNHKKICEKSQENMLLFRGKIDEVIGYKAGKYQSKQILPHIFFTIRNMVGLATDALPKVEMIPDSDSPKSIRRARSIEDNVEWEMIDNDFSTKLAMGLFDAWAKSDAFLIWFWDYLRDDVAVDVAQMEEITISPDGTNIQEAEYVIHHPYKNRTWWKENYPDNYENIKFEYVKDDKIGLDTTNSNSRGNSAQLIRFIQNDILVEKVKSKDGKDIILKKIKNPYFEWRTPEEQIMEMAKQLRPDYLNEMLMVGITEPTMDEIMAFIPELQVFVPITNYFKKPRKNIVQLPSVKLLGEMYSEMIVQLVKEVYISMNEKKRAFNDNLRGCNQKIVVDADVFSKEEADQITEEPNQVIRIPFSDNGRPMYIEKGGEVPQSFHADIAHDEQAIDDAFGHHAISRGTGNSGTLGQDQMNADSDRTPIRFQSRATERAIVELVEGWLQLMRMFYTKEHYAKKWGDKEGMELIRIINEDIEQGISPHIKPGSMIPISREQRAQRAYEMFIGGALDPYTMYVEMGMPNPKELADRLVNWINLQMVSAEDPEELQADMSGIGGMESIERAGQENKGVQSGDMIPPTPPELVTLEHVQAHYSFLGDNSIKIDDVDRDTLTAHAEVDKATLAQLSAEQGVPPEMVNKQEMMMQQEAQQGQTQDPIAQ